MTHVADNIQNAYSPEVIFKKLRLGIYHFNFDITSGAGQPTPSAWRGVMGWALQGRSCRVAWEDRDCQSCRYADTCAYYYLFEQRTKISGLHFPPRPYILNVLPGRAGAVRLEIKLCNFAAELVNDLAAALTEAAPRGIDAAGQKIQAELCRIEQILPKGKRTVLYNRGRRVPVQNTAYPLGDYLDAAPSDSAWEIRILSPLRLRRKQQYLHCIDWPHAFQGLAIRMSALNVMNGGSRVDKQLWQKMMIFFARAEVSKEDMNWRDWRRRSNRQGQIIPMGGSTGRIKLRHSEESRATWWRWWRTAELFQLGKGTTMGNGRIVVHPQSASKRTAL